MVGLSFWLAAAVALAGAAKGKGPEPKKKAPGAEPAKPSHVVVIHDRAPVMFQNHKIGEVVAGQRLLLRESRQGWSLVRVGFGPNWFEGWVRSAMVAPDSLANVDIKLATSRPIDVYRDKIVPGRQFLEVRVKFQPTKKSPPRIYFTFEDRETADLYLTYGRDHKELPYGFVRQIKGMTRPVFELEQKRQTLILKPGEDLIETYVFTVPLRSRGFDLVLKDVVKQVPIR
jgi:hypothetical protein